MLILLLALARRQPCAAHDHDLRDELRLRDVHLRACQHVVRDAGDALLRGALRFQRQFHRWPTYRLCKPKP
jgi:hypothetical protein